MSVVAISIEPNALDRFFARAVAESSGLAVVDLRDFERRLAWRFGAGDVLSSSPSTPLRRQTSYAGLWTMTRSQLATRLRERILEAAADGNVVILSWCAPAVLQPMRHVARILVRAAPAYRAAVAQRRLSYTHPETARMEIVSEDAAIRDFVQNTFDSHWQDPDAFDLVLNSARMSALQVIQSIEVLTARARSYNEQETRVEIVRHLRELHEDEQRVSEPATVEGASGKQGVPGLPRVG